MMNLYDRLTRIHANFIGLGKDTEEQIEEDFYELRAALEDRGDVLAEMTSIAQKNGEYEPPFANPLDKSQQPEKDRVMEEMAEALRKCLNIIDSTGDDTDFIIDVLAEYEKVKGQTDEK